MSNRRSYTDGMPNATSQATNVKLGPSLSSSPLIASLRTSLKRLLFYIARQLDEHNPNKKDLLLLRANDIYTPLVRKRGRIPDKHKVAGLLTWEEESEDTVSHSSSKTMLQVASLSNKHVISDILQKLYHYKQVIKPLPSVALGITLTNNNDLLFLVESSVLKPSEFFELVFPFCYNTQLLSYIPKTSFVFIVPALGRLILNRLLVS